MQTTAQTTATITTANARRYLGQFCKHFAHKLPVEHTETSTTGQVTFAIGTVTLDATETTLRLSLTTPTPDQLPTLQDVVARHLIRFAFREPITIDWLTD
jgi:hypothetical protein